MSNIQKRSYPGPADRLHADIDQGLQSVSDSIPDAAYTATTPGDWAGEAPTTLKAAIDRLAAAYNSSHAPVP